MKRIQVVILALLVAVGMGACSRSDDEAEREGYALVDDQNTLSDAEKRFIEYASEMHTGEIAMAQQAKGKSTDDNVKEHADAVIKTHSDALTTLSDRVGGSTEISRTASEDTQNHSEFLSTLSGSQYDKEFVDLMVADHQSAVDTFHTEYDGTQNSNLKKYMDSTVADIEKRLDDARNLQRKMGSKTARGN